MTDIPAPMSETQTSAPASPPEATTEPIPAPAPQVAPAALSPGGVLWGTGRRKSAVARVRLIPGDGKITVNKRELDKYFTEVVDRMAVTAPLSATDSLNKWNVLANVAGGGHSGQAGAIRLGVARALLKALPQAESTLRDSGYLTRDSREVERKKYGRRKARRRFQFSKR